MAARDISMSLEEFRQYWTKNRRLVLSARAYDTAGRQWIEGEAIFRTGGAYTLIVVQHKDRHFLRIAVKPSQKLTYAPGTYARADTWRRHGIHLTYEEKAFLEGLGDRALSLDELIEAVASSGFTGKEALVKKLEAAAARGG